MAGKPPKGRPAAKAADKEARTLERAEALLNKDPTLSKSAAVRAAGMSDTRDVRRLASKLTAPTKKTKPPAQPQKAEAKARPQAAAPLRANVQKKVGPVSHRAAPKRPSSKADYQPKTELPPLQDTPPKVGMMPIPNLLAVTRPWMMLGFQMTMTGFTLQARMARAAMNMTPASAAMRQGSEAVNMWLAAMGGRRSKPGKG